MAYGIAFYEVIEIVCALLAIGLESYAYYNDFLWNNWLAPFGFDVYKMCEALSTRTAKIVPMINVSLQFSDEMLVGRDHIKSFYRNSLGETGFLLTEIVAVILLILHVLYSFKSKRIVMNARYGAFINGLIFSFLVPTTIAMLFNTYGIEDGYLRMASSHPLCLNMIFCKEGRNNLLEEEIDVERAEEFHEIFGTLDMCQFLTVKLIAAACGALHAAISFAVIFVALTVVIKNEGSAVGEGTVGEEMEEFFKSVSRKNSKAHRSESAISLNVCQTSGASCSVKLKGLNSNKSSLMFSGSDDGSYKSNSSIQDLILVRKLSPQTMYREYKFRKQRIAEMEREQNMTQDPRLQEGGWDYDVDNYYEKNMAVDTGNPKRIYRKPKLIHLQKPEENPEAHNSQKNNVKPGQVNPNIPE